MSDITVFLATTRKLINDPALVVLDVPVIVASMFDNSNEHEEHVIAQAQLEMCKTLTIDERTKRIFIGVDNFALVEYEASKDACNDHFFMRWCLTHTCYFEFQVYNSNPITRNNDLKWCVKGVWLNNMWNSLMISNQISFQMIQDHSSN